MSKAPSFHVVVTFDNGAKASVWTRQEPVFSASMWEPEALSTIGDSDGPQIEFLGRELSEVTVVRTLPVSDRSLTQTHFGTD